MQLEPIYTNIFKSKIVYTYLRLMATILNNIIIIRNCIGKLHFVLPVAAELVKQGHIQLT